jgi:hypothetical protein
VISDGFTSNILSASVGSQLSIWSLASFAVARQLLVVMSVGKSVWEYSPDESRCGLKLGSGTYFASSIFKGSAYSDVV